MTCKSFIKINFLLCLAIHSSLSYSLMIDNSQPLTIKSSAFEIDYNLGYALYHGKVTLNQGTRFLASEQLYLYFDNNKTPSDPKASSNDNTESKATSKIKEIKALGGVIPVKYSENLQKQDGKLSAQAGVMKFTPKKNLLTLEKQAMIEQNGRRLTSELLHYNTKTEVAYTPKLTNKRTKVILG